MINSENQSSYQCTIEAGEAYGQYIVTRREGILKLYLSNTGLAYPIFRLGQNQILTFSSKEQAKDMIRIWAFHQKKSSRWIEDNPPEDFDPEALEGVGKVFAPSRFEKIAMQWQERALKAERELFQLKMKAE